MFHGKIELLIFVRTIDLESGLVQPLSDYVKSVKTGVNLMVDRAPNKGSVGLAFRVKDSTIAFCSAHLAADSQGRNRLHERNTDAARALSSMKLGDGREDFDFYLMHTHVILMGDLNYR